MLNTMSRMRPSANTLHPDFLTDALASSRAFRRAPKSRDSVKFNFSRETLCTSFWGQAWCRNIERRSEYASRLQRGRMYLRHGTVENIKIRPGVLSACVQDTERYEVVIEVSAIKPEDWRAIAGDKAYSFERWVAQLQSQGGWSTDIANALSNPDTGLFPPVNQISSTCTCPDSTLLCKHAAASLYAVAILLDQDPSILFTLRQIEYVPIAKTAINFTAGRQLEESPRILKDANLTDLFGIELPPE